MKIVEAKDGIVKFETDEKSDLTSFLEIKTSDKRYIAQIIQIKYNGAGYTGYARILFNYDGALQKYDKSLPDRTSEVTTFSYNIISKIFEPVKGLTLGKFGKSQELINVNSSMSDKKTLISSSNYEHLNTIIQNFVNQNEKNIVIDMEGVISGERFYAGADFKIPLNKTSLAFIYNECLNDATQESKNLIKDIFQDLAEYSETVPFLPFDILKKIIDDMVNKSHEFRLIVLKNKLTKFADNGTFASDKKEFDKLNEIINSNFAILDLSKLESNFQNKYLQVIYSELEKTKSLPQVYLHMSDSINKKTINAVYNSDVSTIFSSNSNFRYLGSINSLFKNFLIEANSQNIKHFSLYSPFLSSMSAKQYLFVGEVTNYIPLVFTPEFLKKEDINITDESINEDTVNISEDEVVTEDFEQNELRESLFAENEISSNTPDSEDEIQSSGNESDIEEEQSLLNENLKDEKDEPDVKDFHTEIYETIAEKSELPEVEDLNVPKTIPAEEYAKNENFADSENIDDKSEVIEVSSDLVDSEIMNTVESTNAGEVKDTQKSEEKEEKDESAEEQQPTDEVSETLLNENDIDIDNLKILPIDNNEESFDSDIIELNADSETVSDDIVIEMDEEIPVDISDYNNANDTLNQEIIEDVDKVYTTVKDDSISDIDLDLIDELNEIDTESEENSLIISDDSVGSDTEDLSDFEELSINDNEEEFLEPLAEVSDSAEDSVSPILTTKNTSTPTVPVYDAEIPAEDKVESDNIEQGDTVSHAKYGTGIVEKMIKYGNKNLYSINFDNVGRRLLDPNLTEIKKV